MCIPISYKPEYRQLESATPFHVTKDPGRVPIGSIPSLNPRESEHSRGRPQHLNIVVPFAMRLLAHTDSSFRNASRRQMKENGLLICRRYTSAEPRRSCCIIDHNSMMEIHLTSIPHLSKPFPTKLTGIRKLHSAQSKRLARRDVTLLLLYSDLRERWFFACITDGFGGIFDAIKHILRQRIIWRQCKNGRATLIFPCATKLGLEQERN